MMKKEKHLKKLQEIALILVTCKLIRKNTVVFFLNSIFGLGIRVRMDFILFQTCLAFSSDS